MGTLVVLAVLLVGAIAVTWLKVALGSAVDSGADALIASARARRGSAFWIVLSAHDAAAIAPGVAGAIADQGITGVTVSTEVRRGRQTLRVTVAPGADVAAARAVSLRAAREVDSESLLRLR